MDIPEGPGGEQAAGGESPRPRSTGRPARRSLLRASVTLPLAAGVTGCSGPFLADRNVVRVAVSWSAAELTAFRAVLDAVLRRGSPAPYTVEPISLGDDIEAAFGSHGVDRPDIVMLPRAGLVKEHLGELAPIPDEYWKPGSFHPSWRRLLFHRPSSSSETKRPFGLPFKAAHKSAIWYDRGHFRPRPAGRTAEGSGAGAQGGAGPKLFLSDLIRQVRRMAEEHRAGRTERAPLALGGADGWMLTDLFENVLLAVDPTTYTTLTGPDVSDDEPTAVRPWKNVRPALRWLAELWGTTGALSGGVGKCLTMQFPDAVLDVFHYRRSAMVVAPDFAEPIVRIAIARGRTRPDDVGVLRFPADGGNAPPLIAGGDVVVLTEPAGDNARDLVGRLADPSAPAAWIRHGGFISADLQADAEADYSEMIRPLAEDLRAPGERHFDLSDQLGAVGGRDGLWRALQDFLIATGDRFEDPGSASGRAAVARAADTAIGYLDAFERERRES